MVQIGSVRHLRPAHRGSRRRLRIGVESIALLVLFGTWRIHKDRVRAIWQRTILLEERKLTVYDEITTPLVPDSNFLLTEKAARLQPSPLPDWLEAEKWEEKVCIPYAKWQVQKHKPSSCNLLHEMDVTEPGALQFIACGGARCAFSLENNNELDDGKVVLKWTKGSHYDADTYEDSLHDTLAMERLSHSDYILKIYGNCGSSQMLEAASHGALYDQMVLAKNTENAPEGLLNDPESNLRVSYQLAKAVADVHGIDGPNAITFTHNDICSEQYIFVDGVFKLNDFHYASAELRNRTSGVGCMRKGVSWSRKHTKLRAPEEFVPRKGGEVHRNHVDVWMLGNVLYYVLTKKWVMEGRTNREVARLYVDGKRAEIPSFIKESRHPAHKAMIRALFMAWTHDPNKRSSAREIATLLERELIAINGGKSDAPWRVSVRPLPSDYEFYVDPKNKTSSFIGFTDNYKVFPGDIGYDSRDQIMANMSTS